MWVYIRKNNLDDYLYQHQVLSNYFSDLVLLETSDAYFLPRLFHQNFPSELLKIHNGREMSDPDHVEFNFTRNLKPMQIPVIEKTLGIYNDTGHVIGIWKIRPGFGKTVLAIYMAAKIGLRTCIVVDNTGLMRQWIESITKFTNLTINDIGIIKQKHCIVSKPISIAMVQTLCSKLKTNAKQAFSEIDAGRFGFVVYDEVHGTSATQYFASSTLLFRTRNILGLSATPFHYGVQDILMSNSIGNILYETNEYEMTPKYILAYYNSGLGAGSKYAKRLDRISDYIMRKGYYNKIIINSPKYFEMIRQRTEELHKEGHCIMIICITKAQVKMVSEVLEQSGLINRRYYGDEKDAIDQVNDNIIVATYRFVGRGFDFPALSAMILACPLAGRKSLVQSVGRILRDYKGKLDPKVVDLIDMGFTELFVPDVNAKTTVIRNEYDKCEIVEKKYM